MLAYMTRGEGPHAVLMLHGFLGSGRNLGALALGLSRRDPTCRCVLPDLTGHGASPPLPPGADLSTLAGDVLELADGLALSRPFSLIGHSLGGRVALRAKGLAPEAVGQVVLLDSSPVRTGGPVPELARVVDALLAAPAQADDKATMSDAFAARGLSRALVEWLAMNLVAEEGGVRWRIDRVALARLLDKTRAEDLLGVVTRFAPSITLIRGGASEYVRPEDAAPLEAAGVRVVTIEGAGHYLHVEKPGAVLDAITSALSPSGP